MYGKRVQYKEEYCEKAIELLGKGHTRAALAGELNVTRQTIYNWEKQFEDFAEAIAVGDAKRQMTMEKKALALAETGKGGSLMIFLLKNMTDMKDVSLLEHSGRDGGPIESKATSEELDAIRNEYERKLKSTILQVTAKPSKSVTMTTQDVEEE